MSKSFAALTALVSLFGTFVSPPSPTSAAEAIVVSAATSLRSAFEEIGALVPTSATAPRPSFNFGASGDLVTQIRGGAPVDVFAAAAASDMDGLEKAGALLQGTRIDFAANELVLVVPSAANSGVSSFADLAKPPIARIVIVNPKTGPAGRYAEEVFASVRVADAIRPKLVLAENVRQALDYTARGEVDAGVVYATDAALRAREVRIAAVAPADSHRPVVYPIAVLTGTTQPEAARAFVAAVHSESGRAILARHGFRPVPAAR